MQKLKWRKRLSIALLGLAGLASLLVASPSAFAQSATVETEKPFTAITLAQFDQPWAMTFLPNAMLLVTEKPGRLKLFDVSSGEVINVSNLPVADVGGQGGLGDVILPPDFANNHRIYLSYIAAGEGDTRGAEVIAATLKVKGDSASLHDHQLIWQQQPKTAGYGHYSHRLAISPDQRYLFISSGERQQLTPAQDTSNNLGSIVRLHLDGSAPADNPFSSQGGIAAQLWSYGHRNALGLAFDHSGQLWNNEMGPRGGDELNAVISGANYGWPMVSDGSHYSGLAIPDHATRPDLQAPAISWVPSISPSGLVIYQGGQFPAWQGNAIMGGLSSQSLIRVALPTAVDGQAHEVARYAMNARIREIEQSPDGGLWLLEDGANARLLQLNPK